MHKVSGTSINAKSESRDHQWKGGDMWAKRLRYAAVILGFTVAASTAEAQVVDLLCLRGPVKWHIVVDYGRNTVLEETNPSRPPIPYPAQVDAAQTRWSVNVGGGDVRSYILNRASGELNYCDKTGCYPFQCQKAEEVKPKY